MSCGNHHDTPCGEVLDAVSAYDLGLVDEVATSAGLLDTALAVAAEVARRSPGAVGAIKRSLRGGRTWRSGIADEAAGFVSTASITVPSSTRCRSCVPQMKRTEAMPKP